MSRGGRGWYVYGVAAADQPLPLGGVDGVDDDAVATAVAGAAALAGVDPAAGPVGTVTVGEVRAVVSPVRLAEFGGDALERHLDDLVWLGRTARVHDAVVRRLHAHATVVPLRLCTIFTDQARVAGMLRRAQDRLVDDLRRLRGRAEWSVKLLAEPARVADAVAREAGLADTDTDTEADADIHAEADTPATAPAGAGVGARAGAGVGGAGVGRAYLTRKRLARGREAMVRARMEATAAAVHDRLRELAADAVALPPQRPELSGRPGQMVLNGAYLVDRAHAGTFAAVTRALGEAHGPAGFDVELTGPWAPYNFVTATEPVG